MAKKRKSREIVNKSEFNLLKPLDTLKLGSVDDPCFGKLHDLLASECQVCGDSEFCQIIFSQNLKTKILGLEVEQKFKDVEEAKLLTTNKIAKARVLIEKCREEGLKRSKIIARVWEEIQLPKEEIRKLF